MSTQPSNLSRMKRLGAYKPTYKFGFRGPGKPIDGFTEILPFARSWPAILFVAGFLAAFTVPLFTLNLGFGGTEDLFDLTTNLFQLFWALGWSVGIMFLLGILLAFLFAREVLIVEPDKISLRIEVLRLGVESANPLAYLSHLRYVTDGTVAGAKWRGKHLTFDYLHVPVSFGSDLDQRRAGELMGKITATLKHPIPQRLSEEMEHRLQNLPAQPGEGLDRQPKRVRASEPQVMVESAEASPGNRSIYLLILANLVPLAGVVLFDWRIADIMLLFWLESAIIGFFNILKMFKIGGPVAVFSTLFFLGHYGAFMAVHLMFIFTLFIESETGASTPLPQVLAIFAGLWPAILALFISHWFSFVDNFLRRREYRNMSIRDQMHKPYTRIILMHVTIIFGGFLVMIFQAQLPALALLVALKILVDAASHLKEHR